jgi:hypothetical protein
MKPRALAKIQCNGSRRRYGRFKSGCGLHIHSEAMPRPTIQESLMGRKVVSLPITVML